MESEREISRPYEHLDARRSERETSEFDLKAFPRAENLSDMNLEGSQENAVKSADISLKIAGLQKTIPAQVKWMDLIKISTLGIGAAAFIHVGIPLLLGGIILASAVVAPFVIAGGSLYLICSGMKSLFSGNKVNKNSFIPYFNDEDKKKVKIGSFEEVVDWPEGEPRAPEVLKEEDGWILPELTEEAGWIFPDEEDGWIYPEVKLENKPLEDLKKSDVLKKIKKSEILTEEQKIRMTEIEDDWTAADLEDVFHEEVKITLLIQEVGHLIKVNYPENSKLNREMENVFKKFLSFESLVEGVNECLKENNCPELKVIRSKKS